LPQPTVKRFSLTANRTRHKCNRRGVACGLACACAIEERARKWFLAVNIRSCIAASARAPAAFCRRAGRWLSLTCYATPCSRGSGRCPSNDVIPAMVPASQDMSGRPVRRAGIEGDSAAAFCWGIFSAAQPTRSYTVSPSTGRAIQCASRNIELSASPIRSYLQPPWPASVLVACSMIFDL
jgi:hypothetical protein